MKRNNHLYRIMALFVILLCINFLTGCRLAKEAGKSNGSADKLCGIFISIGLPDLPANDWQPEASDFKVNGKGQLILKEGSEPSPFVNKVEGELTDNGNSVQFDGLNGYYFGIRDYTDANGNKMSSSMVDPGFHDLKTNINVTDEAQTNSNEATFSVGPEFRDTLNVNPVFQRADGSYYAYTGEMGYLFTGQSSGLIFSKTFDTAISTTKNGKTIAQKDSYKINIEVVDEVQQVLIKEMNQNDELIKITEYHHEDPYQFVLNEQTKYVVVEETLKNISDQNYIIRSIYSPEKKDISGEKASHTCNFAEDSGIIGIKTVEFVYE